MARAQTASQATPTPQRQALADAWWTGPLLAPGAGTLPHGHILVEPYIYDVMLYGSYNRRGALTAAPHSNTWGSLTYVIYGVTDRFNVGMIPTFNYATVNGGPNSSGVQLGDWAVTAQYRLTQFRVGSRIPTSSVSLQETLPTGRYDNLGSHPNDGFGQGAYTTKLSLYMQTYLWAPNGRIVRTRLNLSQQFSSRANVSGVSVYGTPAWFAGQAHPGNAFTIDAAAEYSATQRWVVATDLVYAYSANTRVTGNNGITDLGGSHSLAWAPALEYNWSANVGIIAGLRLVPAAVNGSASVTPVAALNYVR